MKYKIINLDGLRALAVTIVLVSHSGLGHIVPGGLGVEIFFVLSGYLITALSIRELNNSGFFSLKVFYVKRFFRIFPPLYITYLLFLTLNYFVGYDQDLSFWAIISQLLFFTNYFMIYFEAESLLSGSGVFWSLSVEEHFYLLFPIAIYAYSNNIEKLKVLALCLFMVVLIWRFICYFYLDVPIEHYYYSTDSRIIFILLGGLFAIFFQWHEKEPEQLGWRVLLIYVFLFFVLLLSYVVRTEDFRFFWRDLIHLVVFWGLFRLLLLNRASKILSFLEWKPLVKVGIWSYSIYLSHALIIEVIEHYIILPWYFLILLVFFLSAVFSEGMLRCVDKPLYKYRMIYVDRNEKNNNKNRLNVSARPDNAN